MLIDLKGMLTRGFKMGNAEIEPPKSISTATAVTAQIIAQVASHIYGGTTINRIDEVLAPFVTASYNKHRKTAEEWNIPDAEGYANSRTIKECYDAFQSLEYEVNTLHRQRSNAVCNLWFWSGHQLGIAPDSGIYPA